MHTPDEACAELEHAVRTLGFKAVLLAGYVQRPVAAVADRDPELGAVRAVDRHVRHRQRVRLRPGVGEVHRARGRRVLPLGVDRLGQPHVDLELHVQPPRPSRRRSPRAREVAVHGRRHPPLPRPELRVPRRRRRVGGRALLRPHRPLGEAQRRRHGPPEPGEPRPRPARVAPRAIRQQGRHQPGVPARGARARRTRRRSTSGRRSASSARRTSATCSSGASSSVAKPTTR